MHDCLEERLGIRIARGGEGSGGGGAGDSRWGRVGAAVGGALGSRFGGWGAAAGGFAGYEMGSFAQDAFNNPDANVDLANAMDGWPGGTSNYSGGSGSQR